MSGPAIPTHDQRRAMPAEDFLTRASRIDLDRQMAATDEGLIVAELKKNREQVTAIARRLAEAELAPLLEWILDVTLRRPVFLPNMGSQAIAYCALREGQNQIAWLILQAVAEGRTEALVNREGM